jgi:uncharacterized membrane protein
MVSIGGPVENITSIMVDNRPGLQNMIRHLAEVHGYMRIAFIRGPEGNSDAAERFQIYRETLEQMGIPYDPELTAAGNYLETSGMEAVKNWFDDKHLEINAIVASNDNMALGAMKELKKRNIDIPGKIAVTGFDDVEDAAVFTPPLSTICQPLSEQSNRAVDILIDMLEGKPSYSGNEYLPSLFVPRQSCGCSPSSIRYNNPIVFSNAIYDYKEKLSSEKIMILANITDAMNTGSNIIKTDRINKILDAFYSEILESERGLFISALEFVLNEEHAEGSDIGAWHGAVSALRNSALPLIGNEDAFTRADNILQNAHLFIIEMSLRTISLKKIYSEKLSMQLSQLGQSLSTTFDTDELKEAIINEMSMFNIPSLFISIYDDNGPVPEKCYLFTAYCDGKKIEPCPDNIYYQTSCLLPQEFLPHDRRYSIVLENLYFKTEQLGFILMEAGPMEGIIYETACTQISGCLKGGNLIKKSREAEKYLETRNRNIEGVVLPMLDSISNVAALSSERINFIRQMAEKTEESYLKITETNKIIERAALSINNILRIISIINEISSTINLVALNASIEATHAGGYGAGFAIIAREIKKLSDSTKKNAEEIGRTLTDVVRNVQDSVTTGQESLQSFEFQKDGVNNILLSLEMISKNMSILSESSKKILEAMNR